MSIVESVSESDVKSWLQIALSNEHIENFSVKITGGTEKGDGFASDILFATVTGTDENGFEKHLDLALKCDKTSVALVEKFPVMKDIFLNEMNLFTKVFPAFEQFQIDRDVENPFDSIPRCYGIFSNEVRKVIVMENLRQSGYGLWNLKMPLTRQHIDLVIREYGKFHAISVAMEEQEPRKFQDLVDGLDTGLLKRVLEPSKMINNFEENIQYIHDLLKGDLDENILEKFLAFKQEVRFVVYDMVSNTNGLKVIVHGDCWGNNFMYKYVEDKTAVSKVAILDWQMSTYSSPILDLSYFLFACVREETLNDIDNILKNYYDSFRSHLEKLGSTFGKTYTQKRFLNEWKQYGKFGIAISLLPIKVSYAEKADLPDMAESAENEEDLSKTFLFQIRDEIGFKNRVKPIIEYAIANLI